ncbi:DUF4328 domain-containing protein [Kordia sp. YSTF-M3]|uniref:DUF4328 domain-containing protein n=1 Tax=Kordia aestuariivivens TaxID=2759037 RepID=A0ABR7QDK4_9FLAO|nr:DUF4328 domain-containing protein [Kordia aestuariivivens]MBC8756620.1 DUF4328 domain-containing protein [Kordia aestuariivivens]
MEEEIKDNSQRSKDITMVFYTFIAIDIIAILLIIYQSYVLQSYEEDPTNMSTIELLDIVVPVMRIVQFVIHIVSIVFFVRWFKRAYGNLIRKHQPMEYSENGSAWGFFIPIVSLYRPITTAKEIYLKTQYAIREYNSNLKVDTDTSFIVIWWIFMIFNNMFSSYSSRKYDNAFDIASFVDANAYAIISDVIDVVGIVLALYVIYKITKVETLLRDTNESVSSIDEIGTVIE